MLHNLKERIGYGLQTTDDHIGKVKDFLMDDRSWAVRYLCIDTSKWLPLSRKVVISPISFQSFDVNEQQVCVDLTAEQVKNSPSIDEHKPISREYEELLFKYFGYGYYWMGPGVWGDYSQPNQLVDEIDEASLEKELENQPQHNHLRSFEELLDYRVFSQGEEIGHISDFVLNDETWLLEYVIIDTSEWLSASHHFKIPIKNLIDIDWSERQATCALSVDEIKQCEMP